MSGKPKPYGSSLLASMAGPGWVCLDTRHGRLVTRAEHVTGIATYDKLGDDALELTVGKCTYSIDALPGESPGDALARVCALLGIEVGR